MANSSDLTINFTASHPAKVDQMAPLQLIYAFTQDVAISEDQLPFINPSLFVQDYPQLKIEGAMSYIPYVYGDNYYEIKGDTTIVYQGFSPFRTAFSAPEILNGNILANHTSKWFFGTFTWTDGGDNWELRDSNLLNIIVYYDVTPSVGPGPTYFDWKRFETSTYDDVTGSTITGQGTYSVSTIIEGPPAVFSQDIVSTRLSEKTVVANTDVTIYVIRGFLYKNGVFQNYTGDNGMSIKTSGTLTGSATIESAHNGGTAVVNSFSYTHQTLPDADGVEQLLYKLHYSSQRETPFQLTGLFTLAGLPDKSDHLNPGDSLIHSQYSVKVNPEGYPLVVLGDTTVYYHSNHTETWTKLNDNRFTYSCNGTLILSAPADQVSSEVVDFVDESYSNDGDHYTRNAENREDKSVPNYFPSLPQIKVKLVLSTIPNVESLTHKVIETK